MTVDYIKADDLRALAKEVIAERKELEYLNNAVVEFLWVNHAKKGNRKIVYADCTKVGDMYRYLTGIDFVIKFYEPNVEGMTEDQKKILMYHELLHIGYEDEEWYLVPHDVEDFEVILKEYGMHWNEVITHG